VGIYVQGYGTVGDAASHDLSARLIASAKRWTVEHGFGELFFADDPRDSGAWLSFYPPAGGVQFEVRNNRVAFDAKTSVSGPGYHAALIDLCDHLRADLGVVWRWDAGGDETGYATDRDVTKLHQAFADQFFAYCEFYQASSEAYARHALNLSDGLAIDGYEGVATPLGPLPMQFFLKALDDADDAQDCARRVFPWWSSTLNQEFWISTIRSVLWTEVEWRAARTPWERHVHSVALSIGSRLRRVLDAGMGAALDELAALSGDDETFAAPAPDGIGYLRRQRAFFLPGRWRINLPGYFIEQSEDDGETTCLWFGTQEIRGSSFTFTPKDAQSPTWSRELTNRPDQQGKSCIFRLPDAAKPSKNSEGFFHANAEFRATDQKGKAHLLMLSLFDAKSDLMPRLAEIAQGVWFDPPQDPPAKTRGS
jgi:hypothetical protein